MSEETPQQKSPLEYISEIETFFAKHAKDFERVNVYENGKLKEVRFVTVFLNTKVVVAEKQVRIAFSSNDIMYLEEGTNEFGLAFSTADGFRNFVTVDGFDYSVEVIDEAGKTRLIIRLIRVENAEEDHKYEYD